MNAALDAAVADPNKATGLESFLSVSFSLLQTASSLVIGNSLTALITRGLNELGYNAESAAAAISSMSNGADPGDVAAAMGPGDGPTGGGPADYPQKVRGGSAGGGGAMRPGSGGGTGGNVPGDPTTYSFWNSFVDEWMGAKDKYAEDDAFRKSKVEPAIGKYQAALSDLTNQAQTGTGNYTPVKFGMGDFRTSFVPKSGLMAAEDIKNYGKEGLTSELALTDVMQPNKGSMEYMNELKGLAQWQYEMEQRKNLAEQGFGLEGSRIEAYKDANEDKGSWLDAISDIVKIGDTVGDSIDRWW
jgi:hypothetical protein